MSLESIGVTRKTMGQRNYEAVQEVEVDVSRCASSVVMIGLIVAASNERARKI